ncbi:MAG TPA: site-2 protease family protein [Anaerohalosphaeraceae bacterium]|nr:site-2 protease family protein [Anaerohalosphaeraceae bacterium]
MTEDTLVLGILWYGVFLFSLVFHEAAHALAAWRMGDRTAWEEGLVSLNPLPHLKREPLGMIVFPWLSYAAWGWMLGWAGTPYHAEWARLYPKRAAWMALSGPAANLLLVLAAAGAIRLGLALEWFWPADRTGFMTVAQARQDGLLQGIAVLLSILFSLNLVLFLFNIMPVAPLDGQAWMMLVLPEPARTYYQMLMSVMPVRLMGFFLVWTLLGRVFAPVFRQAVNWLYIGYSASY